MQTSLEMPGFTVRSAAKHLGKSRDWLYKEARANRIRMERDACNQMVIPYGELYSAKRRQDEK